jgi:hypothetical protein
MPELVPVPKWTSGTPPAAALFGPPHNALMVWGGGGSRAPVSLFYCREIETLCRSKIGTGGGSNIVFCCRLMGECTVLAHSNNKVLLRPEHLHVQTPRAGPGARLESSLDVKLVPTEDMEKLDDLIDQLNPMLYSKAKKATR